jgi:hypothetical protein
LLAYDKLTRRARRTFDDGSNAGPHRMQTSKAGQVLLLPGDALS